MNMAYTVLYEKYTIVVVFQVQCSSMHASVVSSRGGEKIITGVLSNVWNVNLCSLYQVRNNIRMLHQHMRNRILRSRYA